MTNYICNVNVTYHLAALNEWICFLLWICLFMKLIYMSINMHYMSCVNIYKHILHTYIKMIISGNSYGNNFLSLSLSLYIYIYLNSRFKKWYIYILIVLKFKRECFTSTNHIIFTLTESTYAFQIIWNREKYVIQQQQHQLMISLACNNNCKGKFFL